MKRRSLTNFESLLGTPDDPRLPGTSIDLALLVDSYHEFAEPQKMIDRIRESLKPGGRMVLIEYRREDEKFGAADKHLMSVADAKAEIEAQGFTLDNILEILPTQHILIFRISRNK